MHSFGTTRKAARTAAGPLFYTGAAPTLINAGTASGATVRINGMRLAGGAASPVTPTITKKKSAVKVEMTVEAPSGKDRQFFRVDFGK